MSFLLLFFSFSSFAFFISTKETIALRNVTLGDPLLFLVAPKVYNAFALFLKGVTKEEEETKEDNNDDKVAVVMLIKITKKLLFKEQELIVNT